MSSFPGALCLSVERFGGERSREKLSRTEMTPRLKPEPSLTHSAFTRSALCLRLNTHRPQFNIDSRFVLHIEKLRNKKKTKVNRKFKLNNNNKKKFHKRIIGIFQSKINKRKSMLIIKHQLYLWNVVELNYKNIISSAGNLPPAPCHCPCPICRMPSNRYYSRIMSSSFLPSSLLTVLFLLLWLHFYWMHFLQLWRIISVLFKENKSQRSHRYTFLSPLLSLLPFLEIFILILLSS